MIRIFTINIVILNVHAGPAEGGGGENVDNQIYMYVKGNR